VRRRVILHALCIEPLGSPLHELNRNANAPVADVLTFSSSSTVILGEVLSFVGPELAYEY